MKTFGNIMWLIFGGIEMAIVSFIEGILFCCTIIYIPVGLQFFKIGKFFLWPMGKSVIATKPSGFKAFVNVLWAIIAGWEHFLIYMLIGCIFCITIVGIPFGKQYFKLAQFVIWPLGHGFGTKPAEEAPAAEQPEAAE